jgi:hypothetical protein
VGIANVAAVFTFIPKLAADRVTGSPVLQQTLQSSLVTSGELKEKLKLTPPSTRV